MSTSVNLFLHACSTDSSWNTHVYYWLRVSVYTHAHCHEIIRFGNDCTGPRSRFLWSWCGNLPGVKGQRYTLVLSVKRSLNEVSEAARGGMAGQHTPSGPTSCLPVPEWNEMIRGRQQNIFPAAWDKSRLTEKCLTCRSLFAIVMLLENQWSKMMPPRSQILYQLPASLELSIQILLLMQNCRGPPSAGGERFMCSCDVWRRRRLWSRTMLPLSVIMSYLFL